MAQSDFKAKTLTRPMSKYLTSVTVDQEQKKEIPVQVDETKISPRRTKAQRNAEKEMSSQHDTMSLGSSRNMLKVFPHRLNTHN